MMVQLYSWRTAPRHFRGIFGDRGTHGHTWLAVVPEALKPFWAALSIEATSTYWDASCRSWILAGARQRVKAERDELETADLFEGVTR